MKVEVHDYRDRDDIKALQCPKCNKITVYEVAKYLKGVFECPNCKSLMVLQGGGYD